MKLFPAFQPICLCRASCARQTHRPPVVIGRSECHEFSAHVRDEMHLRLFQAVRGCRTNKAGERTSQSMCDLTHCMVARSRAAAFRLGVLPSAFRYTSPDGTLEPLVVDLDLVNMFGNAGWPCIRQALRAHFPEASAWHQADSVTSLPTGATFPTN